MKFKKINLENNKLEINKKEELQSQRQEKLSKQDKNVKLECNRLDASEDKLNQSTLEPINFVEEETSSELPEEEKNEEENPLEFLAREEEIKTNLSMEEQFEAFKKIKNEEAKKFFNQAEQRELTKDIIEEAKNKRNKIFEAEGILQMSKNDFEKYFSSKNFELHADLKQQNVGDCYAVAAIYSMSCSPNFEIIIRSSMKRFEDGSWQVKIPLMDENSKIITITPEEILPQENRQFLKRNDKKYKIIPDLRKKLMPVEGKEGLRVLEAAFIKAKFGSVDRLLAESGSGNEVLSQLYGKNFEHYQFNSIVWNDKKKKLEYPGLNFISGEQKRYLNYFLENFNPEIYITTASTRHNNSIKFHKIKGTMKFLVPKHVYSILNIDSNKKIIVLVNPWNTLKPIEVGFNQFFKYFFLIDIARINNFKLLKTMDKVERKTI